MSDQNLYDAFINNVMPLQEIGNLAHGNSGYTAMLARAIDATGKPVRELTVGEVLQLCEDTNCRYNQIYS